MSLEQLISCAPFRLDRPRSLTRYEWTVVRGAMSNGFWDAGQPSAPELDVLLSAVAGPHGCDAWRTTWFGPAPAVAPYAYRCLAAWFASLDPASKARVLMDIRAKNLLCARPAPWGACPTGQARGRTAAELWEGAPQRGMLLAGDELCAASRQKTAYVPMTGQQMLSLFQRVGGTLPPQLESAASYGAQFLQRDFLIGVEVKPLTAAQVAAIDPSNMLAAVRAAIDSIALIWAPGKGASVRFLLEQQVDPQKVLALLTQMLPDVLPEVLPGLDIPSLIPPPNDPLWDLVFGSGLQGLGDVGLGDASSPGSSNTGSKVVDEPGRTLSEEPPPIPGLDVVSTYRGQALLIGAGMALLVGTLVYRLSQS